MNIIILNKHIGKIVLQSLYLLDFIDINFGLICRHRWSQKEIRSRHAKSKMCLMVMSPRPSGSISPPPKIFLIRQRTHSAPTFHHGVTYTCYPPSYQYWRDLSFSFNGIKLVALIMDGFACWHEKPLVPAVRVSHVVRGSGSNPESCSRLYSAGTNLERMEEKCWEQHARTQIRYSDMSQTLSTLQGRNDEQVSMVSSI